MRKKYVAGIVLLLGVVIVAAGVLFFYRYKNTEDMSPDFRLFMSRRNRKM